ncbi:hypothetical protein J8V57_09880 [Xenorhabdus sp. PB61.4]|uniref:hypothetical protein n=1 Tax=Xenorhabdus sp. PB61.4 TaxID=2788940 RepID=UPI001E39FC50|nr:hypothetical protein [Xenorhabdus sp. PB61.4]MCC8366590.1 hypothetical protein [Xenorhabdus sp. PB61.4]
MSLITKEEAQEALSPFFHLFRKAVYAAWNRWINNPVAPHMHHKRVRANIIWNEFFDEMFNEIDTGEYGDIRFARIPYNQGFVVDGRYFIRFKKGDSNFLSSNYPTQTTLKFHDPEIDMFGGEVRLELLYVLDRDGIGVDKIALTQRKDKFVAWAIDLTAENNVIELPEEEANTTSVRHSDVAKKVIKSRNRKADQNDMKVQNGHDG